MVTQQAPARKRTPSASRNGHKATEKTRERSQPKDERETFQGVLQDFNFGPRGVEGFMLHADGRTVQVNVTPDVGFAVVRGIGQNVEALVEPEKTTSRTGDHPIYRLVKLTGMDGKALIFAEPGDECEGTVAGTVKRINYAKNGAADGVILDSGDFILLTPGGMKNSGLNVGDQVTAEGSMSLMPLGQQLVKAKTINGRAVSKRPVQAGRRRAR
jgi:hypothetical protein